MRSLISFFVGPVTVLACMSSFAIAQTALPAPPNPNSRVPEVKTSDEYGVDLISGQATYPVFIGVIGSGEYALSITESFNSTSDARSVFSRLDIYPSIVDQDSKTTYTGPGLSATFSAAGPILDLAQTRERLPNNDYLITGRDGTQMVFDATASDFDPKPKYIIYPNGRKITYGPYATIIYNNFGFEIRRIQTSFRPGPVVTEYQFLNKAYDSSQNISLSLNSIWPKAIHTFTPSSSPNSIGATRNSIEIGNIAGQTFRPFYTQFLSSNANNVIIGKDFLTAMVTNFDADHAIEYRQGNPTLGAGGSMTYYVSKVRKGLLDVNYAGGWSFDYGGYQAFINTKRILNSGGIVRGVQSRWSPGVIPKPEFISDARGTTSYTYGTNFGSQGLQSVRQPDGIEMIFTRDNRDNVIEIRRKAKLGSGIADLVSTTAYPATCTNRKTCNQPIYIVDERGNRTDYVYHDPSGGLLSVTSPSVRGVRPETRNSYVLRNAWIAAATGGYVQIADPIWLLASTSSCNSSAATGNPAAPCATAGDETLTSYDYGPNAGPNNLLLRGLIVTSGGQSTRVCYEYDKLGRRVTATEPSANLSSCY